MNRHFSGLYVPNLRRLSFYSSWYIQHLNLLWSLFSFVHLTVLNIVKLRKNVWPSTYTSGVTFLCLADNVSTDLRVDCDSISMSMPFFFLLCLSLSLGVGPTSSPSFVSLCYFSISFLCFYSMISGLLLPLLTDLAAFCFYLRSTCSLDSSLDLFYFFAEFANYDMLRRSCSLW